MVRKVKWRRVTLTAVAMATLLVLLVIYVRPGTLASQRGSKQGPCGGWRVWGLNPAVSNKTENVCHPWLGYPDDDAPWWQWACLVQRIALTPDYECKQSMNKKAQLGGCGEPPWTPKPPTCLVYSFGHGNNLALELFLIKRFNCSVDVFSPGQTIRQSTLGKYLKFHQLRLGWKDADEYEDNSREKFPGVPSSRMRTLRTVKASLGHEGRSVAVVRLDLGTSTWRVLDHLLQDKALLSTVRQLVLHWSLVVSPSPATLQHAKASVRTLTSLQEHGFLSHQTHCLHDNLFLGKGRNSFQADCRTSYVNVYLRGL